MKTIFTQIINGEIPCYKIAENDNCFAFLDINPLAKGHVLVIPKNEVDYIFNLDDTSYSELLVFAKKIAKALKKSVECTRIGVTVIGLEVPHAHIHLIPINSITDMDFSKPKLNIPPAEMEYLGRNISENLNS